MRTTKNSIITSAIALMLCIVMLAGTTFAWFTDVVTSNGNVIQTGNLDAELHWSNDLLDADSDEWIDASSSTVFTHKKWEPGYTEIKYIKVTNGGSLNFKWKLTVEADGPVTSLSDAIDVYYVNPATSEITTLEGLTSAGTLTEVMSEKTDSTGSLTSGQSAILAIAFHMNESSGNEYQGMSLCDNGFSLKLIATQEIGESDSFGPDYDVDAEWPANEMSFEVSASLDQVQTVYGELASDLIIRYSDSIYAFLPAGVKLADGVDSIKFSGKAVENGSNITLDEGDSAHSYDIHIEGIADGNLVPITVYLGAILDKNISDTSLKLYHEDVPMTRVDSVAEFGREDQYTYDPATGEVVLHVDNFSVFSAVETEADIWDGTSDTTWYNENDTEFTLTTAEQLAGFRDLVDEGNTFEGKTVKLGADIDLEYYDNEGNRVSFNPISYGYYSNTNKSFMGTFDGQKHTIYGLYQNGWDLEAQYPGEDYTSSTAGGGLFASVLNATITNLAVSGASITMECVDMGVVVGYAQGNCTFENIVVTDSKIANYQRYAGGVVGEVCKGDMTKEYTHIFRNVTVDSSVVVSSLWGDFDNACGGVIGGKWGDAKVLMEDVTVAARIDAFSDVTAAYQWYAYRRCGMLIGHTEQNSPKSALNADAPFLTCKNVNVYYGDWVNYTYYQFTNQTDAEGKGLWYSNYPWVRARAGENNGALSNVRYGNPIIEGQKINTIELAEKHNTGKVTITFNQLYGGGQGVYGKANHNGVTITNKLNKTIYIYNDSGWTDLKLDYWFANGDDTWTTIVDPIALTPVKEGGTIYKINIPAYADSFKIISSESPNGKEFTLSELEDNEHINLDGEHIHAYVDKECVCAEAYELASGKNADVIANPGKWYYFCDGTNGNQYQLASNPTYADGKLTIAFDRMAEDDPGTAEDDSETKKRIYQFRYQPDFGVGTTYTVEFTVTVDAACKVMYGCGGQGGAQITKDFKAGETITLTWTGTVSGTNPFSINLRSDDRNAPITMTVSNITFTENSAN